MKHKTLFRNLCKLLGIYFVVAGLTNFLESLAQGGVVWWDVNRWRAGPWFWMALSIVAPLFECVAGLLMFFRSSLFANLAIPGNRPYCPECAYDLTGCPSPICPECGVNTRSGKQE